MSTINVNSILPQSGDNVEVNKIVIKDVVNGPFILYGGSEYNQNNSTGSGVTIIGNQAMIANTGVRNTAIGALAMRSNISGINNTTVGHQANYYNTVGDNNTVLGKDAALGQNGLSTFDGVTAIGNQALNTLTTGSTNTAIGISAGFSLTSGSFNTYLGAQSGSLLQTGNNNIIIGYDSQAASTSSSNSITLGNSLNNVLRCAVTSITSLSDARDKKEVVKLSAGLDFVKGLKPVEFVWNDRNKNGKHNIKDFGFIAQDLKKSQEDANLSDTLKLVYEENPEKLEASYGKLIPILVKAIQDLSAKVEALEAKNK